MTIKFTTTTPVPSRALVYPLLVEAHPKKQAQYQNRVLLQLTVSNSDDEVEAIIVAGEDVGKKVKILPSYYQPYTGSVTLTNET